MIAPLVDGHEPGILRRLGFHRDVVPAAARWPAYTATRGTALPIRGYVAQDAMVPILDQGGAGSCVGNAAAEAILIRELAASAPGATLPSRLYLYRGGRVVDGTVARDAGTTFRSVFTAAGIGGFPPETAWPYSDVKTGPDIENGSPTDPYRMQPPADVERLAFDQRVSRGAIAWQAITDIGGDAIDNVRHAIAVDGYPVCIGVDVDDAFTRGDFDPKHLVSRPTKSVGGHAMVVVGFWLTGTGGSNTWWFKVRNSWGPDFGDAGYVYMDEAYVRSGDLWVVGHVPTQEAM